MAATTVQHSMYVLIFCGSVVQPNVKFQFVVSLESQFATLRREVLYRAITKDCKNEKSIRRYRFVSFFRSIENDVYIGPRIEFMAIRRNARCSAANLIPIEQNLYACRALNNVETRDSQIAFRGAN